MRPRTLAVLLLLVVALGGFIWLYERDLPSSEERVELGKKLLRLDPETVRAMMLTFGDRRLRLERTETQAERDGTHTSDSGAWKLTGPRERRADDLEVETFLEALRDLERQRTLDDVSRDQVGLDAPRAEVVLETSVGDVSVRFGSEIPASSRTVVEVGDGPPFHVVSGALVEDIARDPNDWRSRIVLPFERARIEGLEILGPEDPVVLERAGDGFRITSPIEDDADRDAVDELLRALTDLEVDDFLGGGAASLLDVAHSVRLTVDGVEASVLLEIAAHAAEEAASKLRVGDEVFLVDTELPSLLERSAAEWRSPEWTRLNAFEIEAVRIERHGGEEQAFALQEGEWKRGEADLDYSVVSAFLRSLEKARGAVVETKASSLEASEVEIDLASQDGREERLRLWAGEDRDIVERLDRSVRLELDAESAAEFWRALAALEAELAGGATSEPE